MPTSERAKWTVVIVLLLAALVGFDAYNGGSSATTTGAVTLVEDSSGRASNDFVNTVNIKADSFFPVALGAAFGSYYDAEGSTCGLDELFPVAWVHSPIERTFGEEEGAPITVTVDYQNIILYDLDENSKPKLKPAGHHDDRNKLQYSEAKRFSTMYNWSEAAAAWVLNDRPADCTLAIKFDIVDISRISDKRILNGSGGRNFVSVVPKMVGKSLEQVAGDCTVQGAFMNFGHSLPTGDGCAYFDKDWDWCSSKHVFSQEELGFGMWLYVFGDTPGLLDEFGSPVKQKCFLDLG